MIYSKYLKRALDVVISLFVLLSAFPFMLLAIALIKVNSPGPIFFYQTRVGKNERNFQLIKLRTMSINPNRQLSQTTNADPEIFAVGRILRRLKLDELPQIINVLKGDMSLIGPRPCLEITKREMPQRAKKRFLVRPGLTGLAQVNGNIALSWQERWEYDIEYVEYISFRTDIRIFLKTVLVVLFGEERFKKSQ